MYTLLVYMVRIAIKNICNIEINARGFYREAVHRIGFDEKKVKINLVKFFIIKD
jgi:hypothetical protein